jgi:octaprenyl-diphosphate synthase
MDAWPKSTAVSLERIYAPVREELREVEKLFAREFSREDPLVASLILHISRCGGKRLRPALLLLSAKAAGGVTAKHIVLAMAVETVHGATLIHDDVLDEAEMRRHAPTVNKLWGDKASVLLGDYLFARAYTLAAATGDVAAVTILSETTATVCEGELLQIREQNNFDIGEERYLEIARKKTASLCAGACRLGVACANGSDEMLRILGAYGENLGAAFQIVDDCLDLVGNEAETGKSLGTDLGKGKLTLPLIHLARTSRGAADLVRRAVGEPQLLGDVRDALLKAGSIDYAFSVARDFSDKAKSLLNPLPASEIRSSLEHLADYLVRRPL